MNQSEFIARIVPLRQTLLSRAHRLTEDSESAEDLVQDVMLTLWDMRDKLDDYSSHEAVATTILRNKFSDQWRRKGLEQANRGETREEAIDTDYEWKDQAELIRQIIGSLPYPQSAIMKMKEIEGYENKEIASIIGCSIDNVRQHLSRARRYVREEFIRQTKRRI